MYEIQYTRNGEGYYIVIKAPNFADAWVLGAQELVRIYGDDNFEIDDVIFLED